MSMAQCIGYAVAMTLAVLSIVTDNDSSPYIAAMIVIVALGKED